MFTVFGRPSPTTGRSSGHDADSTEHEQRQNEQRQLTLPALSEQVAHSPGSSNRAMQLPEQLGGDRGPGASSLVDRPGFMNPVDRGGSVSNPKESGLMGMFNATASSNGQGSASSSPTVHIDSDPASAFGFASRPARPHMPHVHHGQHAHQVQRTPQGVVTPGVGGGRSDDGLPGQRPSLDAGRERGYRPSHKEAEAALKKALELDPTNDQYQRVLERAVQKQVRCE